MNIDGWNVHKNIATCKYCGYTMDISIPDYLHVSDINKYEDHQKTCRVNPR